MRTVMMSTATLIDIECVKSEVKKEAKRPAPRRSNGGSQTLSSKKEEAQGGSRESGGDSRAQFR